MPDPTVAFFTSLGPEMVALVNSFSPPGWSVHTLPTSVPDDQKAGLVRNADFVLLFPGVLSGDVLRQGKQVRLVQSLTAGYDRIDLDLARELGIPVANNGGANSIAVAEHTILLILATYRRLGVYLPAVRAGGWPRTGNLQPDTYELEGKTVGLVGFGAIGRQVARRLQPFGVILLYHDPFVPDSDPQAKELGAAPASLPDLLAHSDVVSAHTPLSRDTRHLIGAAELAVMKPTAIIVNTSRGGVIDQAALYAALSNGTIAGAGLDVLETEPPDPNDRILRLENAVITPHQAGPTYESFAKRAKNSYDNMMRVWKGEEPRWVARFA